MNKPAKFTAETYGTKISVEVDHSDLSLDEVMDAFQTLIIGMGYHENSFKNWVIERANEYNETDAEDLKEKLEAWKFEDDDIVLRHRYLKDSEGYESLDELENDFFGTHNSEGYESNIDAEAEMRKYAEEEMEKEAERRMDIIGQNGNEGLHYEDDEDDIIVGASDEEGIDWDCTKYDGEGNLWEADEDTERYLATDEDEDEFSNDGGFDGKPHFEWGDIPEDDDLFEGDEWKPNEKLVEANERYKSEVKKMKSKKRNNKN
jgi:hypothetical protein